MLYLPNNQPDFSEKVSKDDGFELSVTLDSTRLDQKNVKP